jgi:threonylcarbamoyladenosine tRNA methylthiotransferase MtaB
VQEILSDIRAALQGGPDSEGAAQEIVLTGVHLGSWGQDFARPQPLSVLIHAILQETPVPRLRLSSLEPWDLHPRFFDLWDDRRLCRHLHLPLQSGSTATLRRMARKTTPQAFTELLAAARQAIPQVAITTDIIAGFPGESDTEFEESLAFVRQMDFAGGHVFTYSARPGTAAARMPGQVKESNRKARNARLRQALSESASRYQLEFVGQVLPVLWESASGLGPQGWQMSGLTDNYLRVRTHAPLSLWNQITPVRLTAQAGEEILGVLT